MFVLNKQKLLRHGNRSGKTCLHSVCAFIFTKINKFPTAGSLYPSPSGPPPEAWELEGPAVPSTVLFWTEMLFLGSAGASRPAWGSLRRVLRQGPLMPSPSSQPLVFLGLLLLLLVPDVAITL